LPGVDLDLLAAWSLELAAMHFLVKEATPLPVQGFLTTVAALAQMIISGLEKQAASLYSSA
jgi:hypothetical protein